MSLPDCVVFLGPRVPAIDPDEIGLREKLLKLSSSNLPLNSCISLVDYGIIIRDDALKGTTEMIRCMYDLMSMLPDNIDIIADEVRKFSSEYRYVFTSGGVGPTHDDMTFDGGCQYCELMQ